MRKRPPTVFLRGPPSAQPEATSGPRLRPIRWIGGLTGNALRLC